MSRLLQSVSSYFPAALPHPPSVADTFSSGISLACVVLRLCSYKAAALMQPPYPDLYEASFDELENGLGASLFTSVDLVNAYLARIEEVCCNSASAKYH